MADSIGSPPDPPDRPGPSERQRPPSFPGRVLGTGARGARRVARVTGIEGAAETVAEEAIVRAIESQAAERALARVLQGPAVEEAVEQALRSPAVERSLTQAIDSEMIDRVWERLLAGDEVQKLVERIAEAPEVRAAVAAQGVGLLDDLGREAARTTHRLDGAVERIARRVFMRPRRAGETDRAGAVSRFLAFVLDWAILNAAFFAASSIIAFFASAFLDETSAPVIAVGAVAWLIAGGLYLLAFWTLAGQTPAMRFMRIRLDADGAMPIGLRRATRRLFGLALAAIPLGAGFLGVIFSDDRRGWQDRLAGTDVLYVTTAPKPAPWSAPAPELGQPLA
jgi:uncharacterized RDD family membrane protein YckC